eukprot:TRINITY_DN58578_c0_g1_i1.p2 TRINITY_DN58578_c0_g1~~TRINITY_DN58578_c0_g1_i1.p2  ORF type:complete len:135 (+),score=22.64 TRINITY_DN58578_c0_g1_i1:57-461(+)
MYATLSPLTVKYHLSLYFFFFLMIRRPPRSTLSSSSAASDVYKRQVLLYSETDEDHTSPNLHLSNRPRRPSSNPTGNCPPLISFSGAAILNSNLPLGNTPKKGIWVTTTPPPTLQEASLNRLNARCWIFLVDPI